MNVPKLRFKAFDAPWIEKNIGKITDKVGSGSTPRGGEKIYRTEGIPFIRSQNVNDDRLTLDDMVCIPESVNNQMKGSIVQANDILLNITGASIGRSCVVPPNFTTGNVNQHVCIIRLKDGYVSRFVQPFISSERGQKSVMSFQVGSGREGLNFQAVRSFKISLPQPTEQTKIAAFLTEVDEKIAQLTQKHTLLMQYKKGVMQQIFSQELRFKDEDGREFPEWEEKIISEIFTFIQTNSFSREMLNYETGTVKNIHYGDIHTKFKCNFKIEKEFVPFINTTVDIVRIPEECYCKEGDLIIADASEDYADVGKAVEIISLGKQKLLSGLHTYIARDLSNNMSLGFSGYLMQQEDVRLQIKVLATGVSVLSISKGNLAKVKIRIPSKNEQSKIATFLTAIDDKITHTQAQLAAVKQYKQGLLQQMFV